MTHIQEEALGQIRKILKSNFDAFVLTYKIKDENMRSCFNHEWHGDISDVIGMNHICGIRLNKVVCPVEESP